MQRTLHHLLLLRKDRPQWHSMLYAQRVLRVKGSRAKRTLSSIYEKAEMEMGMGTGFGLLWS